MVSLKIDAYIKEIDACCQAITVLNAASIRAISKQCARQLTDAEPEIVINLAMKLLKKTDPGYRFIAYELIRHHRAALAILNADTLAKLGRGLDNWAAVDTFACYLAGPAWRNRQISGQLIKHWARSQDRWWRRAALVCTVPLNNRAQGGSGDVMRTLQICRMLMKDRDDMVVKALSWALRELAKRDASAVKDFLQANENMLAARVVREVKNKLATGLKNPR